VHDASHRLIIHRIGRKVPLDAIKLMQRLLEPQFVGLVNDNGDLEKSISVLIETGSAVNAGESKREQSGIIRRHFRGIKRPRQFFEVP
jgi:hypothetical protein